MERAISRAATRMAMGLVLLAGIPGGAWSAPRTCDLAVAVTPSTIPAGSRSARIRIPAGHSGMQVRSSTGTVTTPVNLGTGALEAEFQTSSAAPPVALIAAVGGSACGFSVVRTALPVGVPLPAQPVTLVVVEPPAARADRDTDVLVYVFGVDERGAPRRGVAPVVRPSIGSIAVVEPLTNGAWRARWRVPAGESGAVGVEASFGWEAPVPASLARTPGPPSAIEITRDPAGAGGVGTPSAVLVRVRDSSGNPTDAPLELESDGAQVGPPVQIERGVFRAPLVVPPGAQDKVILIRARAGPSIGSATFPIAPSAAASVRVTPPGPIRADGSTREQLEILEVLVVDAFGNPVDEPPIGTGGRGEFREPFPLGPGHWALPYRPPSISENTTEKVVVTVGPASTTVDLEFVARRLSVSMGLRAGVALSGGSIGPAAGLEGAIWTFFGSTQLGLVLDVNWWMLSRTSTATVGGASSTYESTQTFLPVQLSLGWRAPIAGGWMLWATLGGGGAMVSNRAQLGGQPEVSESGFAPAASGSLSAGPRLGPGALFLEARATWIGDAKLSTLSGSSITFLGLLGYRFDVG